MLTGQTNFFLKIDEVIGLVDKEELQSASLQVVSSKVDLLNFIQWPLKVDYSSILSKWSTVKEVDMTCRHIETTFDHFRYCNKFTFFWKNCFFVRCWHICQTENHEYTLTLS